MHLGRRASHPWLLVALSSHSSLRIDDFKLMLQTKGENDFIAMARSQGREEIRGDKIV